MEKITFQAYESLGLTSREELLTKANFIKWITSFLHLETNTNVTLLNLFEAFHLTVKASNNTSIEATTTPHNHEQHMVHNIVIPNLDTEHLVQTSTNSATTMEILAVTPRLSDYDEEIYHEPNHLLLQNAVTPRLNEGMDEDIYQDRKSVV